MLYIVLAPLIGSLINGLLFSTPLKGRLFKNSDEESINKAVSFIACFSVFISAVLTTFLFYRLIGIESDNRALTESVFTWISSGELNVRFEFLFDPLSAVMSLVVTWVSFLIHVYSIGYMHGDKSYARYFSYLNLFVFFMLILVLGNNFPLMFVGWEGVGLASYLLIGFWFQDEEKSYAGRKAFIVNRIGDFGFILAIFLIFYVFGSVNYQDVFSSLSDPAFLSTVSGTAITAIALLLFVGAVGKSAQIPLYVWLPDAMAGPTPVSALIHAATMVTAGIYMATRCNIIFTLSPFSQYVVITIAALTAMLAASIAITQNDIKKVLAYSTVSQLGYMFMAVGAGAYIFAVFHLVTHAFFKALLFLGSGSVIHALSGEQDIRRMGGLRKLIPVTSWTFLAGTLAISGVPLLSGFYSKDEILGSVFYSGYPVHWVVGIITAVLTAFYMMRLYLLTFEGESRMSYQDKKHVHESPANMTIPLVILAVLSVVGGYIGFPDFLSKSLGLGSVNMIEHFLHSTIYTVSDVHISEAGGQHLLSHWTLLGFSVLAAFTGIGIALVLYILKPSLSTSLVRVPLINGLYRLSVNKFYVDEIYRKLFLDPFYHFSAQFSAFDSVVIDGAVNGISENVRGVANFIKTAQTGVTRFYAAAMFIGAVVIIAALFI